MFIDTNVFVEAAIGRDEKGRNCRNFLARVEKGEQHAVTSVLVFDEVLYILEEKIGDRKTAGSYVKRFVSMPNLKISDTTVWQLNRVLKSFEESSLRPRDLLHVACMLENGTSAILSYDRDFDSVKEIKRVEP